jgi:hypothetical protein
MNSRMQLLLQFLQHPYLVPAAHWDVVTQGIIRHVSDAGKCGITAL